MGGGGLVSYSTGLTPANKKVYAHGYTLRPVVFCFLHMEGILLFIFISSCSGTQGLLGKILICRSLIN